MRKNGNSRSDTTRWPRTWPVHRQPGVADLLDPPEQVLVEAVGVVVERDDVEVLAAEPAELA